SSSGCRGFCASSNTRRLKSTSAISRLVKSSGRRYFFCLSLKWAPLGCAPFTPFSVTFSSVRGASNYVEAHPFRIAWESVGGISYTLHHQTSDAHLRLPRIFEHACATHAPRMCYDERYDSASKSWGTDMEIEAKYRVVGKLSPQRITSFDLH